MHIPAATYRIQFSPSFDFRSAKKITPYLAELGVSDIHASPVFKARKGSPHAYDMVDSNELNPELGGWREFEEPVKELKARQMGWIQDVTAECSF
jgi:(1->4)-alpha-D-glucan 1-alpha-D-glucosylmutase